MAHPWQLQSNIIIFCRVGAILVNVVRVGPLSPLVRSRSCQWASRDLVGSLSHRSGETRRGISKSHKGGIGHIATQMLPTLLTHGGTFMAMAPSQPLRREKANTTCYPVQWFNGSILHILLQESPCGGLHSVQNGGGKCGRQGGGLGG